MPINHCYLKCSMFVCVNLLLLFQVFSERMEAMHGENRPLVLDEPVEFKK